jgi:hypothetical protein
MVKQQPTTIRFRTLQQVTKFRRQLQTAARSAKRTGGEYSCFIHVNRKGFIVPKSDAEFTIEFSCQF